MSANTAPRTHQELTEFARAIMRALIGKYNADGQQFLDDMAPSALIYRCAGTVSLLLLVNGFDELAQEGEWPEIARGEFSKIIEHVNEKGFDATPMIRDSLTTKLFSTQASPRYHYLDSVSWVLSLALHMRLAYRTRLSDGSPKLQLDQTRLDAINGAIKTTLEIICDAACPEGGWGFANGTKKPDLYYSYGVSESLADFGDYVAGESKEDIGIDEDKELLDFLGAELVQRVEEKRKLTARWLVKTYLPVLGITEVNPNHPQEPDSTHILLYYTYFVVDMLIVNKADEYFSDASKRIKQGIEHALYRSRIDFDRAVADQRWWTDYKSSSLLLKWENHEKPELISNRMPEVYEPGLVPLSLRCNALYAFYIADGEDRKMNDLFQILYDNRHQETGLWDTESYSLMVTERAIEAVVDYNDYLMKFENRAPIPAGGGPAQPLEGAFRGLIQGVVRDYLESPDGARLLQSKSGPAASQPAPAMADGETLDEERLIDLLTSALAEGVKVSNGEDGTTLTADTFRRFRKELSRFQTLRLFEELKKTVEDDPAKQKALLDGLERNETQLLNRLGPWFSSGSENDLGTVLEWLLDKVSNDPTRGKK